MASSTALHEAARETRPGDAERGKQVPETDESGRRAAALCATDPKSREVQPCQMVPRILKISQKGFETLSVSLRACMLVKMLECCIVLEGNISRSDVLWSGCRALQGTSWRRAKFRPTGTKFREEADVEGPGRPVIDR